MVRRLVIPLLLSCLVRAGEKVTYDDHVLPVFQAACLNCHNPDKAKGGLDLSTHAAALRGGSGGKIVEPGDAGSRLISIVRQSAEPVMPPEGDKLSAAQVDVLVKWIEGGLLENPRSKARRATKPKFEIAVGADPTSRPDGPPPMPRDLLLEPPVVTENGSAVRALAASPWAPLLAITSERQVLLHDSTTLRLVGILPFPEGQPRSLSFAPDGRHLVVGGGVPGKSGTTVTFDVVTGRRVLTAGREFDCVLAADATSGFRGMITGGPSRRLKFWNPQSGEAEHSIKKHTDWITALDVSPDGVLVASGDRNGGIWVWEADTGNEFHTLRAHQAAITALVFRSDSNVLASSSEDGTVRFWEMNNGREIRKNDAHPGGVTGVAFARDGRSVTTGRDRKLKLWKPGFGHERDLVGKLPDLPTAVAIDADGERAFVGDASGMIRAYQTQDGKSLGEFPNHPPSIETRIAGLRRSLDEAREKSAAAKTKDGKQRTRVEAARRDLHDAKSKRHQAQRILSAAKSPAGLDDEAASKLASKARERLNKADEIVKQRNEELRKAQESAKQAAAERNRAERGFTGIQREIRTWNAAALNTLRIEAKRASAQHRDEAEFLRMDFSEQAAAVTGQTETVNRKRAECRNIARFLDPTEPDRPAHLEAHATLASVRNVLAREEAALADLEDQLVRIREETDRSARLAAEWIHIEKQRTAEYRRASD